MAVPAIVAPARVTLAEFQRMDVEDHFELILERIYEPMPESFRHIDATDRLQSLLANLHPGQWVIRDAPLPIPEDGEPRSDAIVFRESKKAYRERGGYDATDVQLVVEACLTSHQRDYEIKEIQYAQGNIPEYWIVDLDRNRVEVRTEPEKWGYARRAIYERGETVNGLSVDELLDPDPES